MSNSAAWVAILSLSTKEVLLGFRSKTVADPFCWNLFGGFLASEESIGEAAGRELYEEAGLQINPSFLRLIGKYKSNHFFDTAG